MSLNPYLFFSGTCAEAFEFYSRVFGAEARILRMGEMPPGAAPDGVDPNAVMHAAIEIGDSVLLGSDDPTGTGELVKGFAVSYSAADVAEVHRVVDALSEGGQVTMPVAETFWTPAFGMLTDRFGISWMVDAPHGEAQH